MLEREEQSVGWVDLDAHRAGGAATGDAGVAGLRRGQGSPGRPAGGLEEGGALSPSLQEVKVTVTSNAQCKLVWKDKVGE